MISILYHQDKSTLILIKTMFNSNYFIKINAIIFLKYSNLIGTGRLNQKSTTGDIIGDQNIVVAENGY